MRFPDWSEYESGALGPESHAEVERLLASDEAARRDYAAFQEYRATLRQAVVAESAHSERLEAALGRLGARGSMKKRWFGVCLAASVALAAVFGPRLLEPSDTVDRAKVAIDRIASLQTSDPVQAAEWVNHNVGFRAPTYHLASVAKMTGAECGKDWGAYLYDCDTKKARLIIRPAGYKIPNARQVVVGETTFLVNDRSISWSCPRCAYEIVGCDEETRWKLAKAAAAELFGKL